MDGEALKGDDGLHLRQGLGDRGDRDLAAGGQIGGADAVELVGDEVAGRLFRGGGGLPALRGGRFAAGGEGEDQAERKEGR